MYGYLSEGRKCRNDISRQSQTLSGTEEDEGKGFVREGTHPLGVLCLDLGRAEGRAAELVERRRVDLKDLLLGPLFLHLLLNVDEVVPLHGL